MDDMIWTEETEDKLISGKTSNACMLLVAVGIATEIRRGKPSTHRRDSGNKWLSSTGLNCSLSKPSDCRLS